MSDLEVHSTPMSTVSSKSSDEMLKLLQMVLKDKMEQQNMQIISSLRGEMKEQNVNLTGELKQFEISINVKFNDLSERIDAIDKKI